MATKTYSFRLGTQFKFNLGEAVWDLRKNKSEIVRSAIESYLNGDFELNAVESKDDAASFTLDPTKYEAFKAKAKDNGVQGPDAIIQAVNAYITMSKKKAA